ncbi:hypothetical protein AMAG_15518 [Allomyces macrogynus ATCC 38327]|uniref:Uncharacterized protein n=1 Tax=Allomyces macrogynus (strain ATCC 38327) TaxID=578462 RepID=A0A0L0T949_ALLM3|nr:hypothetical protein AMAG_15518 [Allomyces macrogynus ATCC 38327]|eukprot:KNE71277.1 hypothetical protein AMAG_15518 [Allomyces macrogynus ATCC 38327]
MAATLHFYAVAPYTLTVASVAEEDDDDTLDPCFFDEGYSLAAQTAYSSDRKWMLRVYKERGTAKSVTFTTFPSVCQAFVENGCHVHVLYQERGIEDPLPVRLCAVTYGPLDSKDATPAVLPRKAVE